MKKIKLDLDALEIQTFDTTAGVPGARLGTVVAQSRIFPTDTTQETCAGDGGGMPTCDPNESITCGNGEGCNEDPGTDNYTCNLTCTCGACDVTDYGGCTQAGDACGSHDCSHYTCYPCQ